MITATQFAAKHNMSRQRVHILIQQGRISPKPVLTQVIGQPAAGIYLIAERAKIVPKRNKLTGSNGKRRIA